MKPSTTLTNVTNRINLSSIYQTLQEHRTASLSTLALLLVFPILRNDYLTFLSYGPGGIPYNVAGWFISTVVLRSISRDPFSLAVYEDPNLPFANEAGYLPDSFPLPRNGTRPKIGSHPVPQRQLDQLPNYDVKQKLIERFEALGKTMQGKGLVEIKQSVHERQHKGFFVANGRTRHAVAEETRGEISHVHAGLDGTLHVVMSPQDCKTAIEAGWGQRHGLDGVKVLKKLVGFTMPVNYVLIYAPRNEEEIDVALEFVKAAIGFMAGSRDV